MSATTGIEWTQATWNPVVGCSIVSPGCSNCYAMKMARRIEAMTTITHYAGTTKVVNGNAVWTGKVALAPEHILTQPLRWRRGRRIFVNSMGDLFHESVPDAWIDRVFAVMALARQHTFQVLTKRSARMRAYLSGDLNASNDEPHQPHQRIAAAAEQLIIAEPSQSPASLRLRDLCEMGEPFIPLPNVWLGVSAEDQRRADERVPDLLATPAAVRFVSAEPLLGPINFRPWFRDLCPHCLHSDCHPTLRSDSAEVFSRCGAFVMETPKSLLGWVIVGGESGPGARPMHPDWARSVRDQCAAAGVPFHFKQWGAWKDGSDFAADAKAVLNDGTICDPTPEALYALDRVRSVPHRHPTMMRRVGKRAAGRLLDGQEHNGMPDTPGSSA